MKPPPTVKRRFGLEALETRTLLAADVPDPYGLIADFNLTMHAVSVVGDVQASFSTNFGNHQLVLTGSSDLSVTIDLDHLPSFITNLDITSFKNVVMVGSDHIDNLILTNIGSVAAPGLTVTQATSATDVGSLTIAYLGANNAVLWGSDMTLTATSLDGTSVITNLHSLTVTSESKAVMFTFAPRDGAAKDQTLNFTYSPQLVAKYGISEDAIHFMVAPSSNDSTLPTTPTIPSDSGTPDPGAVTIEPVPPKSTVDPSQVVIVNLSLDDRSRAMLDQLRGLLHSSDADSQQKVLDLLNHTNFAVTPSVNPFLADGFISSGALLPGSLISLTHLADVPFSATIRPVDLGVAAATAPRIDAQLGRFLPESVTNVSSDLPSPVAASLVDGDVIWPTVLLTAAELQAQDAATFSAAKTPILSPTLEDSVRTLGTYIAERVSAEFSPGQQSLVLMVDPQPSRRAETNRKFAAESLIAGLDAPISAEATEAA